MAETPKKPRARKSPAAKKSGSKKNTAQPATSHNALLILVIMALLTVIVLMYIWKTPGTFRFDVKVPAVFTDHPAEKKKEKPPEKKVSDQPARDEKKSALPADVPVKKTVKVYLLSFNEVTEKISLVAVNRTVMQSGAHPPVEETLRELIKGPTGSDGKKGLITTVPAQLKIRSVKISGNTVIIDVNDAFVYNAHGDIISSRIKQIVYTATQFPEIESVTVKVNGVTKSTFGGDGLIFSWPMRRN